MLFMQIPILGKVRRPVLWLLSIIALGIIGIGIIGAWVTRIRRPAYDLEALTVPVEATELTVRITASGTVEPIQTVNLSPETSGILEELYVEQGDRVTEGQRIAQMKNDDVEAQIRLQEAAVLEAEAQLADVIRGADPEEIAQAEAALRSANAQVRDLQARLDLAETQLVRNRQLRVDGAISENELDNFVQAVRSAEASLESAEFQANETQQRLTDLENGSRPEEIAQAEARLAQAQAQLDSTQVQLDDTLIRAPFSGIVTQKFANEGAVVTPTTSASEATSATSTAIVAIASDLEIVAEVPEADIGLIQSGQSVEIVADAFPDQTFSGTVRLIAPEAIERQNVTLFQVRIELMSGQNVLLSNMNVTVAFIGDELSDALVVPTVAVVTQDGQSGVLVPGERDRIRFRPVSLGSQAGNQIQILEGVDAGDLVFVDLPTGQTLENLNFGRGAEPDLE